MTNNVDDALDPLMIWQQVSAVSDAKRWVIAFSGGLDSAVLLHACLAVVQSHLDITLQVVHVNHQLSEHADRWAAHCERVCAYHEVSFSCESIEVLEQRGESLEASARYLRYQALAKYVASDAVLLTAHHLDDQAETFFLQLLRGAGIAGLACMPVKRPLGQGQVIRPLLNVTRAQLQCYAKTHEIEWVDDESNAQDRYSRNYVRHHVLPAIEQRWPAYRSCVARSAAHMADGAALLAELAALDYTTCKGPCGLLTTPLKQLSELRQKNLIRYWLQQSGCLMPDSRQLACMLTDVVGAKPDAVPMMCWGDWQLRRYDDQLYVMRQHKDPLELQQLQLKWDGCAPLVLPGELGVLRWSVQGLAPQDLTVRFRQGGERIRPFDSAHSRSLKQLCQLWRVPPWQRAKLPLIYAADELIAVAGYCVSYAFAKQSGLHVPPVLNVL